MAWAVADRISFKRRVMRPLNTLPNSRWNDTIAVIGGLAIYALMLCCLHQWLIGVPLL
ncbi:MAG: NnrU family protein [Pseudoxanthomonas sp.]